MIFVVEFSVAFGVVALLNDAKLQKSVYAFAITVLLCVEKLTWNVWIILNQTIPLSQIKALIH